MWSSPNALPTIVHSRAFRIIPWQPPQLRGLPSIHHLGMLWAALCFWALEIFTSTQTGLCYLYQSTKGTMKINFKMLFIKRRLQMTDGEQVFFHMIYFGGCISLLGHHLCCFNNSYLSIKHTCGYHACIDIYKRRQISIFCWFHE